MSTSAPMICKRKRVNERENVSAWPQQTITNFLYTEVIPDIIERLFLPFNTNRLAALCQLSLAHIVQDFHLDIDSAYIKTLHDNLHSKTNHMYFLCMFFLFLNVDLKLKTFLLGTDKKNHNKMIRWFSDLRNNCVVLYLQEHDTPHSAFVEKCKEAWLLA